MKKSLILLGLLASPALAANPAPKPTEPPAAIEQIKGRGPWIMEPAPALGGAGLASSWLLNTESGLFFYCVVTGSGLGCFQAHISTPAANPPNQ